MLVDAEAAGEVVFTQTKVWTTATPAENDQWHQFALASFLLGANGGSWFEFSDSRTLAAATADNPWDRVDVGTAAGAYSQDAGGAYVRTFTQGFAVNPGPDPVTVILPPGLYQTWTATRRRRRQRCPRTAAGCTRWCLSPLPRQPFLGRGAAHTDIWHKGDVLWTPGN